MHVRRSLLLLALGTLLLVYCCSGCSPLYVMRAAYEESKILLARESIEEILQEDHEDEETKTKLQRVLQAREFSKSMTLDPGDSFTLYSKVDRDVLAWVLMASKKDDFILKTWWFPFVGTIPYKGFFEKEDALEYGRCLEEQQYEIYVRSTDAFSTLGWFNDPVLSTTLKNPEHSIVNTVIHETVHATIWIPNHVDFNESLATFVGTMGAVNFYQSEYQECSDCSANDLQHLQELVATSERNFSYYLGLSSTLETLFGELYQLYKSDISRAKKLEQREAIFQQHIQPLKEQYPAMTIFKTLNNAEVMQLKIYVTGLQCFYTLFEQEERDWQRFFQVMQTIKKTVEEDSEVNPYRLLEDASSPCDVMTLKDLQ